ncbi:MAG TPA: NAD(P)/FAD-dependent oxidoreductase [Parafilimonas sp.]|nr:NAD(P)/FAD-dependent oxidoreductase [Parafilimonas sp.]
MQSIIVVGAGAAGLMGAYELSRRGKNVLILEAANRLGGRIHTVVDGSFSQPIELGAEFIHGDLDITLGLLKEAGIKYHEAKGKMFHLEKGEFKKENNFSDHWDELMKRMGGLKEDLPLGEFLIRFFNDDKYNDLRESVRHFAEGFDLADLSDASTMALYKEWKDEWGTQYRVDGGYQRLIDYLASACKKNGCVIEKNCTVKKVRWAKEQVSVLNMCSQYFAANKIIVAVPLSVLQAPENDIAYIEFTPAVPEYTKAAAQIGFGTVIKIILQFDETFWAHMKKNVGFIFTDEEIPTWWTQHPRKTSLLTGWFGGPSAAVYKNATDEEILSLALNSLASAFAKSAEVIRQNLKACKITNWSNVPGVNGGYSYSKLESNAAKKIFERPIEQTIFFAGESFYSGNSSGTVEAALVSGREAALKILQLEDSKQA